MTINTIMVIEEQLKLALSVVSGTWPVRWPNELWAATIPQNEAGNPINLDGSPMPFIEAEVISGADTGAIAPAGIRQSRREGLFRVYLVVGQGSGRLNLGFQADTIANYFKRRTVYLDESTGTRLITMDVNIDDGVASHEDGDRYVRQLSTPFILDYVS